MGHNPSDSEINSFNTQPPEGGWLEQSKRAKAVCRFNTQPPEGGWRANNFIRKRLKVSTHSRLKAAGPMHRPHVREIRVSTHSRLKAAGASDTATQLSASVSTHSRLKAAGRDHQL